MIEENDDARGIIRLTQSTKLVREESGLAALLLVREGKLLIGVSLVRTRARFLVRSFVWSVGQIVRY